MEFVIPQFKARAFNCPHCGAYAHMTWHDLWTRNSRQTFFTEAVCSQCEESSLWRIIECEQLDILRLQEKAELIYPDSMAELPAPDMPADIKRDYLEASTIFSRSPRGAAALLRLSLQKLCVHLGESGENINADIRSLASKGTLPPAVVKVADTVRITGNNAVHPGEMSDGDLDFMASKLFGLVNFVVKKGITEPAELAELYETLPEGPRIAAEKRDAAKT